MEHDLEDAERRKVIERLLRVWSATPHLRLGQLLGCAIVNVQLEYVFDDELMHLIEERLPKTERRRLDREFPLKQA